MNWPVTIRILLTLALLVGVYSETGVFTTLVLALFGIKGEIEAYLLRSGRGYD